MGIVTYDELGIATTLIPLLVLGEVYGEVSRKQTTIV